MSAQIERLEAWLARVQRNAALLAEARANGVATAPAASAGSDVAAPEVAQPEEPVLALSMPAAPEEPAPAPRVAVFVAPEAPVVSVAGAAPVARHEPVLELVEEPPLDEAVIELDDSELEEELRAGEVSGAWDAPAPSPSASGELEALEPAEDVTPAPRTPPPESGPQVALPSKTPVPELEAETRPLPSSGRAEPLGNALLGNTVELEPATGAPLDVEEAPPTHVEPPLGEYEESLPVAGRSAVYDDSLRPPATVKEELAAIDLAEREREARRSLVPDLGVTAPPVAATTPPASQALTPGAVARTPVAVTTVVASFTGERPVPKRTFLELLDDSLSLGSR